MLAGAVAGDVQRGVDAFPRSAADGAAFAAIARFVVDDVVQARRLGEFPWGTLVVNLSGTFVLGLVTGLSASHLSQIEYGKRDLTLETARRISAALKMPLSDLIRAAEDL